MIKIKLAGNTGAFRAPVTDKSVRRKWGLESKHQFMLCCDRGGLLCHKALLTLTTMRDNGDWRLTVCTVCVRKLIKKKQIQKKTKNIEAMVPIVFFFFYVFS